jgi:hypothetical protein
VRSILAHGERPLSREKCSRDDLPDRARIPILLGCERKSTSGSCAGKAENWPRFARGSQFFTEPTIAGPLSPNRRAAIGSPLGAAGSIPCRSRWHVDLSTRGKLGCAACPSIAAVHVGSDALLQHREAERLTAPGTGVLGAAGRKVAEPSIMYAAAGTRHAHDAKSTCVIAICLLAARNIAPLYSKPLIYW